MDGPPYWTDVWAAWAAVVTAVITLVGGIAAVGALVFAGKQLRLLRTQVDEARVASTAALEESEASRKASARPLVVFRKVALLPHVGGARFVELKLRNLGFGTALDTEIHGWVKAIPAAVWADRESHFAEFREGVEATLLAGAPSGTVKIQAIAAGGEMETCYLMDGLRATIDLTDAPGANTALVFVTARYKDLYQQWHYYPEGSSADRPIYTWRVAQLEQRDPEIP